MKHIAQNLARTKPLDGPGDLYINRVPAVIVTPAGPRSTAGRWVASRFHVSGVAADLIAQLAGLGATETGR